MTAAERRAKMERLEWLEERARIAQREANGYREAAAKLRGVLFPPTRDDRPKANAWTGEAEQEQLL